MAFDTNRPTTKEAEDDHEEAEQQKVRSRDLNTWTRDIHRAFVEAIMSQGIERASPAVIQKEMTLKHKAVTTERIKSKLQKYRVAKKKSVAQFMEEYDEWKANVGTPKQNAADRASSDVVTSIPQPSASSAVHLLGGEVAAFLSHAVMSDEQSAPGADMKLSGTDASSSIDGSLDHKDGTLRVAFPQISEEERESSIGKAMLHVWEILENLSKQRSGGINKTGVTTSTENLATTPTFEQLGSIFAGLTDPSQLSAGFDSLLHSHDPNLQHQDQTFVSPHYSFESAHATADDGGDSPTDSNEMISDAALLGVLEAMEGAQWGETEDDCGSLDANSRSRQTP